MIILFLIPSFGPGGAERQLSLLAPALVKAGIEVHIGYSKSGPNFDSFKDTGVILHKFNILRNHDPRLTLSIANLIFKIEPDIVQTWLTQMDIIGGFISIIMGIPLIVSERSSSEAYKSGWKNQLRRYIGKRACCIVANSNGGLEYWRNYINSTKLHLIRNCVTPVTRKLNVVDDILPVGFKGRSLIIFAGRLAPVKNLKNLVQALIIVAEHSPAAVMMIFGEGPERKAIIKQISDSGFSNRIVVSNYSTDLPMWMAYASACVSVSFYEGHPNVVIEAAAVGCPLVLSDIDAHREVFDDRAALFVPVDQPQKIAASIISIINKDEFLESRVTEAKCIVNGFSLEGAALSYIALYKRYLSST